MRLKNFRADSMPAALDQVKQQLGPDAVVVRTRTYKRGGLLGIGARRIVEITAGINDSPTHNSNESARRLQHRYNLNSTQKHLATSHPSPSANRSSQTPGEGSTTLTHAPAPISTAQPLNCPPDPGHRPDALANQLADLRNLVENLVREQRHLHAPQMPEQIFDVYLDLIQKEVADEIARELLKEAQRNITGKQAASADIVRTKVVEAMEKLIATAGPIGRNLDGSTRVVALIGPTGVGKTTTIAKLAADFTLRQKAKVGLITIDTYRIGAVDQLRMYADILAVPLQVVLTPADLALAIKTFADKDLVLIDTAGRCQNDRIRLQELQAFLNAAQPHEVHLVLSSTAHQTHLLSAAEKFAKLGIDRIIFTKLDEAISFGVVLSVLRKLDASLSYVTTGQDVPADIEVGNGRRLARLLLDLDQPPNPPANTQEILAG
jgi:flagellar biosynthesis protein FlhF